MATFKRTRTFQCKNQCGTQITTTDRSTQFCKPCAAAWQAYRTRTGKPAPLGIGTQQHGANP